MKRLSTSRRLRPAPRPSAESAIPKPQCVWESTVLPKYRVELNQIERQQLSSMLSGGKHMNAKSTALTMPQEFESIGIIDLKEMRCPATTFMFVTWMTI
jgi:hypothetical protein